ncbi:PLP-dependent aminotransferase family protein [Agromyces mediolanus]|uniref:MocR-like pyridoxine biosynthesis transcription factor PdxR n=1 Tax=Agromyces mediolanus TaxID=41986 RepID=UPI002041FB74|nr:PLP-dependent aminotransferase family protein [Agromyces mediolanus]MCM3658341.1 PLP-dependent aminotransferase family protein [Agromyces mediolanus]
MAEPPILLDRRPGAGLVAQLVAALRRDILDGRLRAGDALPSTRGLARELAIARSSVVAAYDQLAGEGYLELRQGAATRVAELEPRAVQEPAVGDGAPDASPAPPALRLGGAAAGPLVADLSPGVPSTARLDERAWRAAWRAAAAHPPSWSPPPLGVPALRAAIAEHLRSARGVHCEPDDVVVAAGTSEALALVAQALVALRGEGVRVGVEDPGYPAGRRALARHGAEPVPLPLGDGGLDLVALERALRGRGPARLDAVMVTPSHQYPLGGRLPVADRLALLELAARADAFVVEDDYDSEFRHTGAPLPALASLDSGGERGGGERVVLVGSFSKVLTPWLRLGYLVLPAHAGLRAAVAAARSELDTPVAGPVQLAVAEYLERGALRRHIAATRREYTHRRRLVQDALGGLEDSRARLTAIDGGLHAVLELPDRTSERALVARLAEAGVIVAPLAQYAARAGAQPDAPDDPDAQPGAPDAPGRRPGPAGIVLGYAGVGDLALAAALERIRAALGA